MNRKLPLLMLSLLFLGIALYSGYRLFVGWSEYKTGEDTYASLAQYVQVSELPQSTPESEAAPELNPSTEPEPTLWPTVDFEALQAINPDVVAWIWLEGTEINYPVVRGADNSQYLHRLFDGTYNSAGSIFMDYRNDAAFGDRNTILYGHHMKNKTMFYDINRYKDQAFYDAHPTCLILTPEGNYTLEFFAGYVSDLNSDAWRLDFSSDEVFAGWLAQAVENSTFRSDVTPTAQDRIVTLSTCSYEYDDARYVLLGVLTRQNE